MRRQALSNANRIPERFLIAAVIVVVLTSACGSPKATARLHPSTTTSTTVSTTRPGQAASLAVLPVVPCPTSYGAGSGSNPFVPHQLPAAVPSDRLRFYSNGLLTVLGPTGWACSALVAADGGQLLDVYPAGQPDFSRITAPPGTAVVQLEADYTGHGPGALLVCPFFPGSPAVTFLQGSPPCGAVPAAETTQRLTEDVVAFQDAPGVRGTGAGSGGPLGSSGDLVYPQVKPKEPMGGVTVGVLSCTLPVALASLCQSIQGDFLVRDAPAAKATG